MFLKFTVFVEGGILLSCLQEQANGPNSEAEKFCPNCSSHSAIFLEIQF
jgi:nitrate/TMAO reductase-like tetraheme cytochrome c subunit